MKTVSMKVELIFGLEKDLLTMKYLHKKLDQFREFSSFMSFSTFQKRLKAVIIFGLMIYLSLVHW